MKKELTTSMSAANDEDSTLEYQVVQLPDEDQIILMNGEGNENVVLSSNAKVSRLVMDNGKTDWKDGGNRQIRLLTHREERRSRLVMRQKATGTVLVNHYIHHHINLKPHSDSDKAFVWKAREDTFLIELDDGDSAQKFKDAFEICQMHAKEAVADEADQAESFDRLSINEEASDESFVDVPCDGTKESKSPDDHKDSSR